MSTQRISTCLWFESQAEEGARFYTSLFDNSEITSISRFGKGGPMPEGTVMMVNFTLDGISYSALNGGPMYKPTEAWSFVVGCDTQEEIDRLWTALTANGGAESRCGWCKDRFGFSWQIIPNQMKTWMSDPAAAARVVAAFMPMTKLEIPVLEAAYRGA